MRLLILTQKVDINDPILGFFHNWIFEFAKDCEQVSVICLEKGKYDLPRNVKVLSLGKDNTNFQFSIFNLKIFKKLKYLCKFYKYIWQERKSYDAVFVHMNPEYAVLGGVFWKLWEKKVGLWYTHKAVNMKLWIAEKLCDKIFTVSKESFKLKSKKIEIMGHGIDSSKFKVQSSKACPEVLEGFKIRDIFKIIYVGRITEIKNQRMLIETVNVLVNKMGVKNVKVEFIGSPIYDKDKKYLAGLKKFINENKLIKNIEFIGSVPHNNIADFYNKADLSINLCPTGGVDKAVLESMACECLVLAYNKAFVGILPDELVLESFKLNMLAEKICWLMNIGDNEQNEFRKKLRKEVEDNHNLAGLVKRIVSALED